MSELSHDEKRKIAETEIARRLDEYDHMRPQIVQLTKERDELREALTTALAHLDNHAPELARITLLASLNKTDGE